MPIGLFVVPINFKPMGKVFRSYMDKIIEIYPNHVVKCFKNGDECHVYLLLHFGFLRAHELYAKLNTYRLLALKFAFLVYINGRHELNEIYAKWV